MGQLKRPVAFRYAAVRFTWAAAADGVVTFSVPMIVPGPPENPVTDVPGLSPRSPVRTVEPVFVTVVEASTP
jgi:hypothetical protein